MEYDDPPDTFLTVAEHQALNAEGCASGSARNDSGIGVEAFYYKYLGGNQERARMLWSIQRSAVEAMEPGWQAIGVLQKVNNSRWISKLFRAVNSRLETGGVFAGCVEVNRQRRRRFEEQHGRRLGGWIYRGCCLIHRVTSKMPLVKGLYFAITRGHDRYLSMAEVLGRLISCGFEIIEHREIGGLTYFSVRKIREASVVRAPTYGPICVLTRVGRGENPIKVYKFRTMHPYAEFLQEYVYRVNSLETNGKFRNDFRVPAWGKLLRRLWLDELPMILNVLKGEMKIVGVRPLSFQYFSLYPPELQKLRKRHTPGLIPPFYADLPKEFDDIVASEMRYLIAYEKAPIRTDVRYFCIGLWNILIKRSRSA